MKKRGLCLALCLCLLTGALPALAQDGGALCVLNDGWFVNEDYLAQYPDRSLEMIPAEYLDNGIDTNLRELLFTTDCCCYLKHQQLFRSSLGYVAACDG